MIKTSSLGGGGLSLGDLTQTTRTELDAGNVLLPLDGTILDAGTYPLLAAKMSKSFQLNKKYVSGTANTLHPRGAVVPLTGEVYAPAYNGGNVRLFTMSKDANGYVVADTLTTGAPLGYDACCSTDGQYVYVLFQSSSTILNVAVSADFGATFTEYQILVTAGLAVPITSARQGYNIQCSPNGQNVQVGFSGTGGRFQFALSTNFGVTWAENWIDAATYSGGTASFCKFSADLTKAFVYYGNSAAFPNFLAINGVRTNITSLTLPFYSNALSDISQDGTRLLVSTQRGLYDIDNGDFPYFYSDDDGVTWTEKVLTTGQYDSGGTTGAVVISSSGMQLSTLDHDYAYCMVSRVVGVVKTLVVLLVHLPTGNSKVIATPPVRDSNSTLNSAYLSTLTVHRGVTGKEEYVLPLALATNELEAMGYFEIGYDQFLTDEHFGLQSSINTKIVADAP